MRHTYFNVLHIMCVRVVKLEAGPALGVGKLGSRLGPPINKVHNYIFSFLFFIFLFHWGPPNSIRLGPRLGPPIPCGRPCWK